MKILYLIPSLRPHGGIRVLVEHCNWLASFGHEVTMQNFGEGLTKPWLKISDKVEYLSGSVIHDEYDVIVAGTPPLANRLNAAKVGAKKFFFLQMAEHLFSKGNKAYNAECFKSYKVPFPIIGISRWVEYVVRENGRGSLPMYYTGNGVGEEFWDNAKKPLQMTILVEGWETYGDAKDVNRMAPKLAKRLKEEYGCRIIAYSQFPLTYLKEVPDEYYQVPSAEKIVELNQQAHIMLKASVYDARSCAPVEAMACGAVPVRAILHGDDDLLHDYNCLRSAYGDEDAFYNNAKRIIEDENLRFRLKTYGNSYRNDVMDWKDIINDIESIFKHG
jgi:hypothetical protein